MRCRIKAILALSLVASMTTARAWSKPRGDDAIPATRTICIAVRSLRAEARAPFMRGFMRAVLQHQLPIEQKGWNSHWRTIGELPNLFRLSAIPCVAATAAESLGLVIAQPDSARSDAQAADSLVCVEILGDEEIITDYISDPRGGPPPPPAPDLGPTTVGIRIRVAVCAAESLAWVQTWTPLRVRWSERPKNRDRRQEIRGWMAGMATMQTLYRRAGWLADNRDLVFESQGRNQ